MVFPDFVLLGLFVVCVSIIFLFFLFLFFVPVVVAGSLSGSVAVVLWPFCAIFQEVLRQCFPDALQSDPTLQRLPESIQATLEEDPATKRWAAKFAYHPQLSMILDATQKKINVNSPAIFIFGEKTGLPPTSPRKSIPTFIPMSCTILKL